MKLRQLPVILLAAAAALTAFALPCGAETTTSVTTTTPTDTTETTTTTTRPVMDALEYEIVDGEVTITSFSWLNESIVTIPDEIEGCPVIRIAEYAFQYCFADEVILPKTVREIGDYSFMGCEYLISMTIPEDCTYIGYSAFQDCLLLETVVIPETVTEIGYCAFEDTKFIRNITDEFIVLGDGILYVYQGDSAATEVTIPDGVRVINHYAFADRRSIETVNIPDSVTHILSGAFDNCEALENIYAPASMEQLEPDALYTTKWFREYQGDFVMLGDILVAYRGKETEVTVPDGIAVIGASAFEGNPFITTVSLPASVKEIRTAAFYKCTSLQVVTTMDSLEKIGDKAFYFCHTLKFINLGSKLHSVGAFAFVSCDALESLTLPVTVTSVGRQAMGYNWDNAETGFTKNEALTIFSNAEAVKEYAKNESLPCEEYVDEVTMTTPVVTTTTTTTISTARNAGTPTESKGWVLPVIVGAVLVIAGGAIGIGMGKKKTK